MDAKEFWIKLEYRICREIGGMRGVEFHGLWCDGVIPEGFEPSGDGAVVRGYTWMGRGGRHQEKWRFELVLPANTRDLEGVDWQALFPVEGVTGWLELRQAERVMRITPGAAIPREVVGGGEVD